MSNVEQTRFGLAIEKTGGANAEVDVQGIHVDVPASILDGVFHANRDMYSAIDELRYSPDIRIPDFYDRGINISRLNFGPSALSKNKEEREAQLTKVATILVGLDRMTGETAKDPKFQVGMMGSTVLEQAGGLPLLVTVGWTTGVRDEELTAITTSVGRSIAKQLSLDTHAAIDNRVKGTVSRLEGVKLTTNLHAPPHSVEAGAWTSQRSYRRPNRLFEESQRFVARGYNLASLDESLVCLGSLIALGHPEDAPPLNY